MAVSYRYISYIEWETGSPQHLSLSSSTLSSDSCMFMSRRRRGHHITNIRYWGYIGIRIYLTRLTYMSNHNFTIENVTEDTVIKWKSRIETSATYCGTLKTTSNYIHHHACCKHRRKIQMCAIRVCLQSHS